MGVLRLTDGLRMVGRREHLPNPTRGAHVAHLEETRTIAKARIKTDKTSSRVLAELLRVNGLPESYWPLPEAHVAIKHGLHVLVLGVHG
jgi:hypothetical protein